MANRFLGLVIEGDDEPAAAAPAPAAAAPKAAAPVAAKAQRQPRQADATGSRQHGQGARTDRPRGERPQGDRPARRPQGDRPRRVASEGAGDPEFPERRSERPRGGPRNRGMSHSSVSRGKREFDRQGAPWKESEKSDNMALGKPELTDDAEPATVGEVLLEGQEADAPAPAKIEDEEDAKLQTLEQYKQQLQTKKPAYELPAARVANEGQEIKGAVLLTREEEEEELFSRKEAAKKAAAPKERKVAQTIVVEPKPLLDSRRGDARPEGRGGFRGGARGGRGGSAPRGGDRPHGTRSAAAAPNLNDQAAFPSLK